MSELIETPETTLGSQQLRHQADLAIQGFRRLLEDVESRPTSSPRDRSIIHPLCSKKELLTELGSSLLPLLKQQVASLTQALEDPDMLRQDPGPTLELILEIQPKLAQNWDQIIRTMNHIMPLEGPQPDPAIDQNLKEFKPYRLRNLATSIRGDLKMQLQYFLSSSRLVIEEIELTRDHRATSIGCDSYELDNSIDSALEWSKVSELDLLNGCWEGALLQTNAGLKDLLFIVHLNYRPISRPIAQLAKSFIPLLKLTKLFFNKLLRLGLTIKADVQSYTEMSTAQLLLFERSAQAIARSISASVGRLIEPEVEDRAQISQELIHQISQELIHQLKSLSPLFQSVLLLLNLYIIPLVPNNKLSSAQIPFKAWLVTWYTLFFKATNNAINAANSFAPNLN
ncbi:hypothetical protein PGT21_011759 [Puccinia graminis f. sp. tritici]|uniref:Uncharacterized protein n=2 Tax=Puccinia graminis f. sp. tritici TaxID=56615 RepID=A0A5B0NYP7_PUCGR|nr:hypothetical protein PGT21_011759 [Puccinia graminis f. sp. tritici]KAA1093806.1 hypothetical protein PGTUg99_030348 [Puccinia graminis f. sp. tritici]